MIHAAPGCSIGLALVLLAAPADAQDLGEGRGRPRPGMSDPSAVIAADFALGRNSRDKGTAEALRDTAAPAALVLVQRPVPAGDWLKHHAGAAEPTEWQPQTVWASCDGGYAVSRGVWRRGGASGGYFALWQRQAKGGWRWLLHEDGPPGPTPEAPDMIAGKVAECFSLPRRPPGFVPAPISPLADTSRDGSLEWTVRPTERCALTLTVRAWDGKAMREVLGWSRPARLTGCG